MKDTTAIIGDIHGSLAALEEILAIAVCRAQTIVFVGDYIDRGEDSAGVIERLVRFSVERPDSVFLRGNHEQNFQDYLDGDRSGAFFQRGGAKTLASYSKGIATTDYRSIVPSQHRSFLHSLQDHYETDELVVTHSPRADSRLVGDRFHVSGHVPQPSQEPLVAERSAFIDTGCGTWPGAPLTCFFWPSRQWSQSG